MRHLILILLTLSISCGEEVSKPLKRKEKEGESQEFDHSVVSEEKIEGQSDGYLGEGCCSPIDLEVLEQIEVAYDRPDLDLYRSTFVVPSSLGRDLALAVRDFGLGLE